MSTALTTISFATVASHSYIDHAAGLLINLREYYPDSEIIICALDDATEQAFSGTNDQNLKCVPAATVWGEKYWRNLTCRMSIAERAFASKAAVVTWALETHHTPVLLLDSDLLFLSSINDVIEQLATHPLLLIPARHPWIDWRKSARFGLFSAGLLGANVNALPALRAWRAMCFEACMATKFGGLYYEQKYLDCFISVDGLCILGDPGINVSQTLLNLLKPKKNNDASWVLQDGTPLRVYHYSRSTDDRLELAKQKRDYNRDGMEKLNIPMADIPHREVQVGNRIGLANLTRFLRVGGFLDQLASHLGRFSKGLITIHRVFTLNEHSLRKRFLETFKERHILLETLKSQGPKIQSDMKRK